MNTPQPHVLIVEDEMYARQKLIHLLKEIDQEIDVVAELDTVKDTVAWLQDNQTDLIFLDIHLADGNSFNIFKKVEVETPIIFTTAYNKYMLDAFQQNSVDYLLKPITSEALQKSIFKLNKISAQYFDKAYKKLAADMEFEQKEYQERFIVKVRDKIMSIHIDEIAYFEGEGRYVYLTKKDARRYIIDFNLADLEDILPPKKFTRINRSFISNIEAIKDVVNLPKSRLMVKLEPIPKREVMVSSVRAKVVKDWLST